MRSGNPGRGERSLTLTVRSGLNQRITRDSTLTLTIAETHGLEVMTGTMAKDGGSNRLRGAG